MYLIEKTSKNLKETMIKKNITLTELQQRTGLSKVTLKNILNAKTMPRIKTVIKIADALKISIDFLAGID